MDGHAVRSGRKMRMRLSSVMRVRVTVGAMPVFTSNVLVCMVGQVRPTKRGVAVQTD